MRYRGMLEFILATVLLTTLILVIMKFSPLQLANSSVDEYLALAISITVVAIAKSK